MPNIKHIDNISECIKKFYKIDYLNYYTSDRLRRTIIQNPKVFKHIRKDRTDYNELKELYEFLTI